MIDETGQTIIREWVSYILRLLLIRMKREFNVEANVGQPQVAYRETIRKDGVEVQGKFIRQSGGRGQYGDVWLRLSQNEAGKGFEFINSIKGGVVPSEYIPASSKRHRRSYELTVLLPATQWLILKLNYMMVVITMLTPVNWLLILPVQLLYKTVLKKPAQYYLNQS